MAVCELSGRASTGRDDAWREGERTGRRDGDGVAASALGSSPSLAVGCCGHFCEGPPPDCHGRSCGVLCGGASPWRDALVWMGLGLRWMGCRKWGWICDSVVCLCFALCLCSVRVCLFCCVAVDAGRNEAQIISRAKEAPINSPKSSRASCPGQPEHHRPVSGAKYTRPAQCKMSCALL